MPRCLLLGRARGPARADLIYDVSAAGSFDFVPFEDDGTPNRPPGEPPGQRDHLRRTARYLTHAEVVLSRIGPVEVDNYTIDLYKPDGSIDPSSGLNRPGTLIASYTTSASNAFVPGTAAFVVDWNFAPTLVPDTIIAVVSSAYSTTTPGQFVGPFAAVMPPVTGSALNTIWYGDGTPSSWTADPIWAINDGAVTNYIDMRFTAIGSVPEPGSLALLGLGAGRRRGGPVDPPGRPFDPRSTSVGVRREGLAPLVEAIRAGLPGLRPRRSSDPPRAEGGVDLVGRREPEIGAVQDQGGGGRGPVGGEPGQVGRGDPGRPAGPEQGRDQRRGERLARAVGVERRARPGEGRDLEPPGLALGRGEPDDRAPGPSVTARIETRQATSSRSARLSHSPRLQQSTSIDSAKPETGGSRSSMFRIAGANIRTSAAPAGPRPPAGSAARPRPGAGSGGPTTAPSPSTTAWHPRKPTGSLSPCSPLVISRVQSAESPRPGSGDGRPRPARSRRWPGWSGRPPGPRAPTSSPPRAEANPAPIPPSSSRQATRPDRPRPPRRGGRAAGRARPSPRARPVAGHSTTIRLPDGSPGSGPRRFRSSSRRRSLERTAAEARVDQRAVDPDHAVEVGRAEDQGRRGIQPSCDAPGPGPSPKVSRSGSGGATSRGLLGAGRGGIGPGIAGRPARGRRGRIDAPGGFS